MGWEDPDSVCELLDILNVALAALATMVEEEVEKEKEDLRLTFLPRFGLDLRSPLFLR